MPSIDNTNKAIFEFLSADAELFSLAAGGVWDSVADDGTRLPFVVFQRVTGVPDYTFGALVSSERQSYMIKAYAETRARAAQIVDRLKILMRNATLSIAGATLLACVPTHDLPAGRDEAAAARSLDTFMEGFYCDVTAA